MKIQQIDDVMIIKIRSFKYCVTPIGHIFSFGNSKLYFVSTYLRPFRSAWFSVCRMRGLFPQAYAVGLHSCDADTPSSPYKWVRVWTWNSWHADRIFAVSYGDGQDSIVPISFREYLTWGDA